MKNQEGGLKNYVKKLYGKIMKLKNYEEEPLNEKNIILHIVNYNDAVIDVTGICVNNIYSGK